MSQHSVTAVGVQTEDSPEVVLDVREEVEAIEERESDEERNRRVAEEHLEAYRGAESPSILSARDDIIFGLEGQESFYDVDNKAIRVGSGGRRSRIEGAKTGRPVVVSAQNAYVVDSEFDIEGDTLGATERPLLHLPAQLFENTYGVSPGAAYVIEQNGDIETLFAVRAHGARNGHATNGLRYFFRGEGDYDPARNGFVTELTRPAESIEEVMDEHLRPPSVQAADQAGREVIRQGDWFFVEQHDEFMPTGVTRSPALQPGGDDQFLGNHAPKWLGHDALNPDRLFVKEAVEHRQGDHETIQLEDGWYEARHNGLDDDDVISFEVEGASLSERSVRTGGM